MNYDKLSDNLSIINQIFDPTSDLYLDNLLDLATSLSYDIHCSGTWKNSKPIKAFFERYSNFADKICKSRVSLNDFNVIKTVGQGGFGRVDLVKHKETKNIYAMKIMEKSTFVQNSFNGFWEERDIMAKNCSDWLIKCFYTFMDLRKLYIVMEYMPGGDLYHWMGILEDFSEEQTHFYAMEMVLAVEVLHNMGFIHRDLKPDNMLLDKNGHMKLADFGTCIRVQKNGKVSTNFQVGTPDYICPEILRNAGVHNLDVGFEIDWWAFGIVIYELFYGETPFEGESTSTLYQNIMRYKDTLVYPDDKPAKPALIDLLSHILTEPTDRFTVAQIKQHPYLAANTDHAWTFSTIRSHQSPVLFTVSGDDDTANITFDANDRRNNIAALFTNNNYFSGENLAFSGFTFNRNDKYTLPTGLGDENQQRELATVQLAKQQLSVKLESTNEELVRTQSALAKLEKDLADKDQIITAKKSDYIVTLEANKQLRAKIEATTKSSDALQREIEQLKVAIVEKEALMKNMKTDTGNLTDEVANLEGKLQSRDDKISQLVSALEEKHSQLEGLKKLDSLLEEEKTRNQNLTNELSAKNRKIVEYESQLELNNQAQFMKTEVAEEHSMQRDHDELERLLKEKQVLDVRLSHLTNDLEHSEQLRNALQSELATEKQKKHEAEKMRDKLAKDVSNQKMIVASWQTKLNSSEDQKKVLKQKINVIESEKDQIEQQKKMFESMVEVRKAENDGLAAELEEAEELFEKKEKEFECEREMLQGRLNALFTELDEIKADSAEKTKKLEQLKLVMLENDHLSQQIDKYKLELEDRKHDLGELSRITISQRNDLDKNEKQMASDKAKINALVCKIDEMIKNPKSVPQMIVPRKKKDNANAELLRRVKLLESELSKEKAKFQEKYKELTEVRNEFQHWQDQDKELKTELDNKNSIIKDLKANLNSLMMQKTVLASSDDPSRSTELKSLEGKIEILKKGKGRHKILWNPCFGSLKPFKMDIFQNEGDNTPSVSIDLRSVMHIREPSVAECVHIDKSMLPQILQIIYEKQEPVEDSRRMSMISSESSRRNKSSTYSIDESNASMRASSLMLDVLPSNGIYNIENHSFVPMRFRSYTNCDICHQSCSDLLNPPAALECGNCKKRIHFEHISSNDYKIQWCQGAIEVIIFKVESKDAKFAWLNSLNQFKEYQKTNEVQIAPNTFYRSIRQSGFPSSPGNLSIP